MANQTASADTRAKPFAVSAHWIDYAHGPGAESEHPLAIALCNLIKSYDKPVKLTLREHVAEVLSVAELYTHDTAVQEDERLWFRLYPNKLIKRARGWLAHNGHGQRSNA